MNSPQQLRKRRNVDKGGTSVDVAETGTGRGSGAGAGAGATAAATSHHDAPVSSTPKQDPQQQQQQQPQQQSWTFWLRVLKCGRVAAFRLVLLATAIVVMSASRSAGARMYRRIIDEAVPKKDTDTLFWCAVWLVGLASLRHTCTWLRAYLAASVSGAIVRSLQCRCYAVMQTAPLRLFMRTPVSELQARMGGDASVAKQFFSSTLADIVSDIVSCVLGLGIMARLHTGVTATIVLAFPLFLVPSAAVRRRVIRAWSTRSASNIQLAGLSKQTLEKDGAVATRMSGAGAAHCVAFEKLARRVESSGVAYGAALGTLSAIGGLFWSMAIAGVYIVGGYLAIQGSMTMGRVVQMSVTLFHFIPVLSRLRNVSVRLAEQRISFERIFEVWDLPNELDGDQAALMSADEVAAHDWAGGVELKDVCFSYANSKYDEAMALSRKPTKGQKKGPGAGAGAGGGAAGSGSKQPKEGKEGKGKEVDSDDEDNASHVRSNAVLHHVSLSIAAGEKVALCGKTGAGKSSIAMLLARLYDPDSGSVELDGVSLRRLPSTAIPALVGSLSQQPFLFRDTVGANIRLGRPEASQEEVEAAAKAAAIHDTIMALPKGYDTRIAARGGNLSGGERQRVCIARLMLQAPRMLVLDEPMAALDGDTAASVLQALDKLQQGRTCVFVTHRLATLQAVDRIVVLSKGRVVQQGSFAELSATSHSDGQLTPFQRMMAALGHQPGAQ